MLITSFHSPLSSFSLFLLIFFVISLVKPFTSLDFTRLFPLSLLASLACSLFPSLSPTVFPNLTPSSELWWNIAYWHTASKHAEENDSHQSGAEWEVSTGLLVTQKSMIVRHLSDKEFYVALIWWHFPRVNGPTSKNVPLALLARTNSSDSCKVTIHYPRIPYINFRPGSAVCRGEISLVYHKAIREICSGPHPAVKLKRPRTLNSPTTTCAFVCVSVHARLISKRVVA